MSCRDEDLRADAVAIALGSDEPDLEPMVSAGTDVFPQLGRSAQRTNHDVDPTVPVEIGKSGAAVNARGLKRRTRTL